MRKSKEQRFIESVSPDTPDAWLRYVKTTVTINEEVRQRCRQQLAERHADMDAERDNPDLYRYHAAEAACLQAQIDNHTRTIQSLLALPPGPRWITADTNMRSRMQHEYEGNRS